MDKKLYFKVYQERECMKDSFVETIESVINVICPSRDWEENGENPPVFEPIYMTEEEFNNLPDFQGF